MENKSHALAAGTFVLVVAALLVALAIWLTRDAGVKRVVEFSTHEAVSGLQPQARVHYRGIAVGQVQAIEFDRKVRGNVLVRMSVDEEAPISPTTFATLGYQGVTGLAFVQLDDDPANKALPPGPDGVQRLPLRPSLLSRLTDRSGDLLVQVEEVTRRVNLLLAPENQKLLANTVQQFGQAAAGMSKLATSLDGVVAQRLDPALAAVPALAAQADKTLASLQTASTEVSQVAAEFGKTARTLNERGGTLDRVGQSSDAVAASARALNATTLPRMDRAADDVSRTARQTARVASHLGDNPQALLYGSGPMPPGPGESGFTAPVAGGRP